MIPLRCAALLPLSFLVMSAQTRFGEVARQAQELQPELVKQRRDFHMNPELSNREERTSRVIADRLKALGFDTIRTGVSRYGIVALLKGAKPGPVVAIRADMDALPIQEVRDVEYKSRTPGVMHACGHDVHMTVALGVAELLSRRRGELAGTVKFIFQPAEEGAPEGEDSGARQMIAEGALNDPRPAAIFALHTAPAIPAGKVGWAVGPLLASSDRFTIRILGKQVHAAYPHEGIDPIVIAAECITALQTIRSRRIDPLQPVVLTVGSIHGGNRFNIIPGEVTLQGTLRTHNEGVRERVIALVREIVDGVAASHGAKAEVRWAEDRNPPTVNDPGLARQILPVMREAIGAENVLEVSPAMGAEDFSYFQKEIPGVMFWLGVGNEARGITGALHTPHYDADESSLATGVKVMAAMVLDTLERKR